MFVGSNLAAFALTAVTVAVIPGPGMLFVLGRSLALGRRSGMLTVLGDALGMVPHVLVVALGVGFLVASSIVVFTVLKLAGAAYLIYLGVQAIRHRHDTVPQFSPGCRRGRWVALREGFLAGVSNPKSAVFFVAVLPQFVSPASGAEPLQIMILGGIFLCATTASGSLVAFAAGAAHSWVATSRRHLSQARTTSGIILIGLGASLALTNNRP